MPVVNTITTSGSQHLQFSNTPPFGYDKLYLEAGGVFGKLPFPLLTIHRGDQTYITQQFSYNLMNFMEFVSDRYATLMVDHYFGGFFLNKIPLLRKLKWREACSLKVLYGQVAQNRPSENSGLLKFPTLPDGTPITYTLEQKPYVEASVGITNISKFSGWYGAAFSSLDHPGAVKYGLRFGLLGGVLTGIMPKRHTPDCPKNLYLPDSSFTRGNRFESFSYRSFYCNLFTWLGTYPTLFFISERLPL